MKQEISGGIKADKRRLTAKVGERIAAELEAGDVQEAFCHLKGWYCVASETQLAPCPQMMELSGWHMEKSSHKMGTHSTSEMTFQRMGSCGLQ